MDTATVSARKMHAADFIRSILLQNVAYCRLCLRTGSERRLLPAASYRRLVCRLAPSIERAARLNEDEMVCYVCDAMLERANLAVDMVQAAQVFALTLSKRLIDVASRGTFVVEKSMDDKFSSSVLLCQKLSRLCVTETLAIDSLERNTIDLTEDAASPAAPAAPAAAAFSPAANVVLVPAGQPFRLPQSTLPGQSSLPAGWQIIEIVTEGNEVTHLAVPPPPSAQAPPAAPAARAGAPAAGGGGGGGGEAGPNHRVMVEDTDCVAIIETNISDEMRLAGAGSSEGQCVIPDSYVYFSDDSSPAPPAPAPSASDDVQLVGGASLVYVSTSHAAPAAAAGGGRALGQANGQLYRRLTTKRPNQKNFVERPLTAGVKVEHENGQLQGQMAERLRAAVRPAPSGPPAPPANRDVDWEEQIPMEVISYADDPPAQASAGSLGRISEVYSQAAAPGRTGKRVRLP